MAARISACAVALGVVTLAWPGVGQTGPCGWAAVGAGLGMGSVSLLLLERRA